MMKKVVLFGIIFALYISCGSSKESNSKVVFTADEANKKMDVSVNGKFYLPYLPGRHGKARSVSDHYRIGEGNYAGLPTKSPSFRTNGPSPSCGIMVQLRGCERIGFLEQFLCDQTGG